MLDIVRRTAEIFDLRLGEAPRGAEVLPAPLRRAPRRVGRPPQLYEAALERWGAWAELRELIDEQAGRAPDSHGARRAPPSQRQADEEKLDDANRGRRHAARGAGGRSDRSQGGRGAGTTSLAGRPLVGPGRSPELQASTASLWAPTRTPPRCAWRRSWPTGSATRRAPSIVTPRSSPARPPPATTAGCGQRARGDGQRRRPARPRGGDPRAGLPARRRSQQAGRRARRAARIGPTIGPSGWRILGEMAEIHQRLGRLDLALTAAAAPG